MNLCCLSHLQAFWNGFCVSKSAVPHVCPWDKKGDFLSSARRDVIIRAGAVNTSVQRTAGWHQKWNQMHRVFICSLYVRHLNSKTVSVLGGKRIEVRPLSHYPASIKQFKRNNTQYTSYTINEKLLFDIINKSSLPTRTRDISAQISVCCLLNVTAVFLVSRGSECSGVSLLCLRFTSQRSSWTRGSSLEGNFARGHANEKPSDTSHMKETKLRCDCV